MEWFEGYIEASSSRSDIAVLARRTKVVRWGQGHLACGCLGERYHGVKGGCVGSGQRELACCEGLGRLRHIDLQGSLFYAGCVLASIGDGRATAIFGTRPMEAGGNKRTSSSPCQAWCEVKRAKAEVNDVPYHAPYRCTSAWTKPLGFGLCVLRNRSMRVAPREFGGPNLSTQPASEPEPYTGTPRYL